MLNQAQERLNGNDILTLNDGTQMLNRSVVEALSCWSILSSFFDEAEPTSADVSAPGVNCVPMAYKSHTKKAP
jgi:hypothetical protein